MNKIKILVMYANEYDVDGNKGTTINYFFFGENGEMLKPQFAPNGQVGYQRAKVSLPWDKRAKIIKAPAIYDAELEMSVGSDGKPVMKVVNLDFVGDVSFVPAFSDKQGK